MKVHEESERVWSVDLIWVRRLMFLALSIQIIQSATGAGVAVQSDGLQPSFGTVYRISAFALTSFAVISGIRGRARPFLIGVIASQIVVAFGGILFSLQALDMIWLLHRHTGLLAWNAGVLAVNLGAIAVAVRHLHVADPSRQAESTVVVKSRTAVDE